jgi:hypothetical protein
MDILPPATIWQQFSVVGIIVLCFVLAAFAVWRVIMWLTDFQTKREKDWQQYIAGEMEKQRTSDASQRREDRENWRRFFSERGEGQDKVIVALTGAIEKLVSRIESLEVNVQNLSGQFREHEVGEMEILRDVANRLERRQQPTQPRKQ